MNLHLNGEKVGNDVLTPGWTQFTKRVYYQTYDVTGMVRRGTNTIGAILGDGWYASDLAFKGSRLNYGGTPRFLAQLVLQLSDGSTQTVVSDGSWKASYGPIQFADLLIGSGYDARQEMPGWDTTNFNDSTWSPVLTGLSATTGGYTNVTALVASLVANNQLNFVANNTTMGGDPAYGVVKTLQINFTLGGTNQTLVFRGKCHRPNRRRRPAFDDYSGALWQCSCLSRHRRDSSAGRGHGTGSLSGNTAGHQTHRAETRSVILLIWARTWSAGCN